MIQSPSTEQLINADSPFDRVENLSEIDVDIGYNRRNNTNERLTINHLFAVLTAVTGTAFHFGYASGVMNNPQGVITQFISESYVKHHNNQTLSPNTVTWIFSFSVSVFALGGMIGGICSAFITDRFGRKGGMFLNNIVSIIAAIFMFISKIIGYYEVLIIGRLLIGVSCGYGSSVAPTYINEITPRRLRGTFGTTFQLGVVVILFLSQIITLEHILGGYNTWHYALGLTIVFSIAQVIMLCFVPESPKYLLLMKGDTNKAEKALKWLRQNNNNESEINEMQSEQQTERVKIIDLFRQKPLAYALLITVILQLSQQLSGINAIFYYSKSIFLKANFSTHVADYATLALGGTNIIVTVVSIFLIDRLGRRPLHLLGLTGIFISSVILVISLLMKSTGWSYVSLISSIIFVVFFSIGPGSIPWLITAELFSQAPRAAASSVAVLANWSANFAVGIGFKPLFEYILHEYTFLLFSGLLVFFILFTFFFVPETKAKTVNEIYDDINNGKLWEQSLFRNRRANIAC